MGVDMLCPRIADWRFRSPEPGGGRTWLLPWYQRQSEGCGVRPFGNASGGPGNSWLETFFNTLRALRVQTPLGI